MNDRSATLLARLAPRFSDQTENVAVEALGYVLSGSEPARRALTNVIRQSGASIGQIVAVRTQATGENLARPDLAGFDEHGTECVLIEAKFWAGLTENQPVAYLRRLPEQQPSVLLFVAPTARFDSLWAELRRRVAKSEPKIALHSGKTERALRSISAGGDRWLVLVSWSSLLGQMTDAVASAADSRTEADILQLRGLAVREDEEAFLPVRPEELGPEVPRRLMGLKMLVDRATDRLVGLGLADLTGTRVQPLASGYGRYLRLAGAGARWGLDYGEWAAIRDTPLWLTLWGWDQGWPETKPLEEVRANLEPVRLSDPPGLVDRGDRLLVPIQLPVGVEQDAVLEGVVHQLVRIAQLIGPA